MSLSKISDVVSDFGKMSFGLIEQGSIVKEGGKYSLPKILKVVDAFIHSMKLPQSAAALRVFRESDDSLTQAAALYAAVSAPLNNPPMEYVMRFKECFGDFKAVLSLGDSIDQNVEFSQIPQQNDAPAEVVFDPAAGSASIVDSIKQNHISPGKFLSENTTSIRVISGVLAAMCAILGVGKLVNSCSASLSGQILDLSKMIVSCKNIWGVITGIVDSILPVVYNFFGVEYIDPVHKRMNDLSVRVKALQQETIKTISELKTNFFVITHESVTSLQLKYDKLNDEFIKLTENEKSMYNLHNVMSETYTHIASINEIMNDLKRSTSGKQRPVALWICGDSGVGKTRLATEVCDLLAKRHDGTVYQRTASDKYFSGYYNQVVFCQDDLMQKRMAEDIEEFHRYTSEDQKDVVGAAIPEKGRPFTSKYFIATSNQTWIGPPCQMEDLLAMNRRRDVVVYMHFPQLAAFKAQNHGAEPMGDWFKDNFPIYYLVDATFGFRTEKADAQSRREFSDNAQWIIRQITVPEMVEGVYELQKYRSEQYRMRITAKNPDMVGLPKTPIVYDPQKFLYKLNQRSEPAVPVVPAPMSDTASDFDLLVNKEVFSVVEVDIFKYIGDFVGKKFSNVDEILDFDDVEEPRLLLFDQYGNAKKFFGGIDFAPSVVRSVLSKFSHTEDFMLKFDPEKHIFIMYKLHSTSVQNNPTVEIVPHVKKPCIMLSGPPGVGKTMTMAKIENVYHVKYTRGEVYPSGILYCDDITISSDRFQIAKKLVCESHDGRLQNFVVVSLNKETRLWKNLPEDERTLLTRRCHEVEFDYARALKLLSWASHPTECLKQKKGKQFESLITIRWTLLDEVDSGIPSLKPCHDAVIQMIQIEAQRTAVTIDVERVNNIKLSYPEKVDLLVILDDDQKPTAEGVKLLVNGKTPASMAESLVAASLLARMTSVFSPESIADRSQVSRVVTSKKVHNTTRFRDIVIRGSDWAFGLTTIDGCFICYEIDTNLNSCIHIFPNGDYNFNGRAYCIETQFDYDFVHAFAKLTKTKIPEFDDVKFVTPQQALVKSDAHQLIGCCVSAFGILTNILSTGILAFREPKRPVVTNVVPSSGPISSVLMPWDPAYNIQQSIDEERSKRVANKVVETTQPEATDPTNTYSFETDVERRKRQQADDQVSTSDCETPTTSTLSHVAPQGRKRELFTEGIKVDCEKYVVYLARNRTCEDDCDYGIVFDGRFYFLGETHPFSNMWFGFCRAVEEVKDLVIMKKATRLYNRDAIMSIKAKSYSFDGDLSLHWAEWMCFGTPGPYDFANEYPLIEVARNAKGVVTQGSFDPIAKEQLDVVMKNKIPVICGGVAVQYAVMLYDRIGMCNAHAPSGFAVRIGDVDYDVDVVNISRSNDILIFKIRNDKIPLFPSVMNHVVKEKELTTFITLSRGKAGILLGLGTSGSCTAFVASANVMSKVVVDPADFGTIAYSSEIAFYGSTGVSKPGDCGAPVMLMAPTMGRKFIGIHARGAKDISMAAPITFEYLTKLIEHDSTNLQSSVKDNPFVEYEQVPYQDTQVGLTVVGHTTLPVHVPVTTTKYWSGIELQCDTQPTIKSIHDPRNIMKRNMLKEGIARYAENVDKDFTLAEVEHAATEIGSYLSARMVSKSMTTRVLTNTEAVNGASNVEFSMSRSIDRHGAVGYPYSVLCPSRKTKQDFLYQNQTNALWYFRDDISSQRILSNVNMMIDDAKRGVMNRVTWVAYCKDEPVKLKKIYDLSQMKTRVFFSGPMDYQLAYRRAFNAAIWRISELHLEIPVRVGLNPVSLSWEILAYKHLGVNSYGFDSDMSNWDGTVPLEFIRAVPIIYNKIYRDTDSEWKIEDDVMRSTLHQVVEGADVAVYGTVYKLNQAMISGFPGTAVDNSLINWMLFYCVWRRIMLKNSPENASFQKFMKLTVLSVFGDDNICTVSPAIIRLFHFNSFKIEAAKFGFVVTDAAKEGGTQPDFKPFHQLEFLKRSFHQEGSYFMPLLDKNSLFKSLYWTTSAPAYHFSGEWRKTNRPEVFIESLCGFFREASLYGKDEYDRMCGVVLKGLANTGYEFHIPTFESVRYDLRM